MPGGLRGIVFCHSELQVGEQDWSAILHGSGPTEKPSKGLCGHCAAWLQLAKIGVEAIICAKSVIPFGMIAAHDVSLPVRAPPAMTRCTARRLSKRLDIPQE
jgi:hypothetical protein